MKRILCFVFCFLLFPISLFAATPASTNGGVDVQNFSVYGGTAVGGFAGFSGGGTYSAHGSGYVSGVADAAGGLSGYTNGAPFHESSTSSKIKSSVSAVGDHSHVQVSGVAAQGTWSSIGSSQAFSQAGQVGVADYAANGRHDAAGKSKTEGYSSSWAGTSPDGTASFSGAICYGIGSSSVTEGHGHSNVVVAGSVQHAEYSQSAHAVAWTTGDASFMTHGRNMAAGIAITNGSSWVRENGSEITAHSESFSMSE